MKIPRLVLSEKQRIVIDNTGMRVLMLPIDIEIKNSWNGFLCFLSSPFFKTIIGMVPGVEQNLLVTFLGTAASSWTL